MLAMAIIGQVVDAFELAHDIVGIEHSRLGSTTQSSGTQGSNIGVRSDHHAEAGSEGPHLPYGFWPMEFEAELSPFSLHRGNGHKGGEVFFQPKRARPRAASPMVLRQG